MRQNTPPREKLLYLETFGCQMNVSDSEKISGMLRGIGYRPTDDPQKADLILLNTCSVRDKAEQKVYSRLGRLKVHKQRRERPALIGVGGCIAQREGENLLRRVPYVDLVFGTHNLHLLTEIVLAAEQGERRAEVDFLDEETRVRLFPSAEEGEGVSRFVTVMQGCDNFCSYCIVPYVRGREISRPSAEIVAEIQKLAESGVREVTLLGQNVNSYGLKVAGETDFAGLLRQVATVDGIGRIRFTTSHPKDISPALVACFAEIPKLCGHIHLPAQSGSDRILRLMGRGYSRADYLEKIAALRQARPEIAVTGDIIAGFPGETEADFDETLSLVEEVRYADLFSFVYSPRPETAAASLPGQLPYEIRQERLDRLQKRQREITREIASELQGKVLPVLVDGVSKQGEQLCGRTDGNRVVNLDGPRELIGRIVPVRMVRVYQNSLLGERAQEGK